MQEKTSCQISRAPASCDVSRVRSRAFTLVELLVVIGIIALLISILLPALNKARASAQSVACMSNLHQVALAAQLYRNDYKDYYVPFCNMQSQAGSYTATPINDDPPTRWFQWLVKYTVTYKVFNCPTRDIADPQGSVLDTAVGSWLRGDSQIGATCGYAYVRWIGGYPFASATTYPPVESSPTWTPRKYTQILQLIRSGPQYFRSENVGVFMDGRYWMTDAEPVGTTATVDSMGRYNQEYHARWFYRFLHGTGIANYAQATANVCFLDSHVESVKVNQVLLIPYDYTGNTHALFVVQK